MLINIFILILYYSTSGNLSIVIRSLVIESFFINSAFWSLVTGHWSLVYEVVNNYTDVQFMSNSQLGIYFEFDTLTEFQGFEEFFTEIDTDFFTCQFYFVIFIPNRELNGKFTRIFFE